MRKIVTSLILCGLIVLLAACNHNVVYDSDEAIAGSADSYSASMFIGGSSGGEYSATATITGSTTIWRYDAESDAEITASYLLSVTEGGKAKLVLITPDDEVITLSENTDNTVMADMQPLTISVKQGENRIKLIGYDSPKLKVRLDIEEGKLGTGV